MKPAWRPDASTSQVPSVPDEPISGAVVDMAAASDRVGYWLVGSDGGVLAFGDARFSAQPVARLAAPVVALAATADVTAIGCCAPSRSGRNGARP